MLPHLTVSVMSGSVFLTIERSFSAIPFCCGSRLPTISSKVFPLVFLIAYKLVVLLLLVFCSKKLFAFLHGKRWLDFADLLICLKENGWKYFKDKCGD